MRTLIALIAAATLAGCAGVKSYPAPAQTYRQAGQEQSSTITGAIDVSNNGLYVDGATLRVNFDGVEVLRGPLGRGGNGDVTGGSWRGQPVSSSCSGTQQGKLTFINCMIFVSNERTVTLSF